MAPALARRTPPVNLNQGRPKRQAALNRKETPGAPKKKTEKTEPKPKVAAVKAGKKTAAAKQPAKRTSPRKTASATKTSAATTSNRKSAKASNTKNKAQESENTVEKEEEVEEDNPNEVPLNDDEKNENTTEDSQVETEEEEGEEGVGGEETGEESELDDGELENDDDEDFDPDDDPEKLWCFCKTPHGNRFMICCDTCEDWFHGDCVGISMGKGREMEKTGEEWCCDACKEKLNKTMNCDDADDTLSFKSPLNSPLKKMEMKEDRVATKARSLSLDDMKCNLAKLKDRKLSLAERKQKVKSESEAAEDEATKNNNKSRDSLDNDKAPDKAKVKVEKLVPEIPGFTFDQVPIKKEEKLTRKRSLDLQEDSEELKKKRRESLTAKPKIRTTPTPKSMEPIKACLREDCSRPIMKGAIYCSRECIYKYTTEAIKVIEEEKRKKSLIASPDSKLVSHGSTIISPATSSTDRVTETTQERIAVFEKSSGKIVAGVMAPTKKYLFAWLEEHPTYEVLKLGKQTAELKNPKKDQNEIVRNIVRKALRDILVLRCKESEMAISLEAVTKISKKIEIELLKLYGETSQKYKTKYRSLIFNLKDQQNKILYRRVVSGEISPSKLVHMPPEQLATPELARWREQESKHHIEMVKKREQEAAELSKQTSLKKTHKGEVEINSDNATMATLEIRAEPAIERQRSTSTSSDVMNLLKDTTEEHSRHLFDSNCGICTGKVAPPGEAHSMGVSTAVVQAVPESSVPSPDNDSLLTSSPPSPDTSEISLQSPTTLPPSVRKQPSVWRGFIMMQKVSRFVCTAYAVSGTCENLMETLPDTIQICGRIPPTQVWEYLSQMKEGRKNQNKFIDVIRFEMSSNEEKAGYIKLYTYFYTRQRIGVVGNCYSGVKDMYILPLASHDPIPPELKPLPGLPKPRPHMLLGIIVRVKTLKNKASDLGQPDSSPDLTFPKKKKKKKEKKLKEIEKERVEVEAQKKLLDIIFKSRGEQGESSTGSLDPKTIMKNIVEKKTSDRQNDEDDVDMDEQNLNDKNLEEEQIQKLREQEEEISRLKQEIENSTQEEGETEMVVFPDPDDVIQKIKENVSVPESPVKGTTSEVRAKHRLSKYISDSEDVLDDTSLNESTSNTKTESIPFMSDSSSVIDTEPSQVIPFMSTSSVSATTSFDKNLTEHRDSHNLDDDVMNLIEDIKIEVPKFPIDIRKNRLENKMPQLPAISLPMASDFKLPPPGTIPTVPLPPNIKLPPGVPFPPLPPKPIAPEILQIPTSSHVIPDTPQSPPDSMKGLDQLHEERFEQPIRRIVDPRRRYDFQERPSHVERPNHKERTGNVGNPLPEHSSASTGYYRESDGDHRQSPYERSEQHRGRREAHPPEPRSFPGREERDRMVNKDYGYRDDQHSQHYQPPFSRASKNYDQPNNMQQPQPQMDEPPRMLSWRNKNDGYPDRIESWDRSNQPHPNPNVSSRQPNQLIGPELHDPSGGPLRPQMRNPDFREDQFYPRFHSPRNSYDLHNQPEPEPLVQFDPGQRPPFNSHKPPFNSDGPRPPFNRDRNRPPFNRDRLPFDNEGPALEPPFHNNRPPFHNERPPFNNARPPFNIHGNPRFQPPKPRFNMPRPVLPQREQQLSGYQPQFHGNDRTTGYQTPPHFGNHPLHSSPGRFPRHQSPNINHDVRSFPPSRFPGPSADNAERADSRPTRDPFGGNFDRPRGRFDDGPNMNSQERFHQRGGKRKTNFVGNRFRDESDHNNRSRDRRDARRDRKDFGKEERRKTRKEPTEISLDKEKSTAVESGKDKFGRDVSRRGAHKVSKDGKEETKKVDLEDGEVQESGSNNTAKTSKGNEATLTSV